MTLKKENLIRIFITIFLVVSIFNTVPVAAEELMPLQGEPNHKPDGSSNESGPGSFLKEPQMMSEDDEYIHPSSGENLRVAEEADDYGYTVDDTVPLQWVDAASSGTNSGMSGPSNGQYSGPVSLGFSFPYYENTFSQVYIAASGYLSFTDSGTWPNQSQIPTASEPNNVIAPYWAPLFLSQFGPAGQVYYLRGGEAPDRYFVVEWYEVAEGIPNAITAGDDQYHFQAILYENGDIRFQYQLMEYSGTNYCGSSGIEDSTGNDGLTYLSLCSPATSYKAVLFSRPGPSARVRVSPKYQSEFISPSESRTFPILITNLGDLESDDIFELTVTSDWTYRLLSEDGKTQLTDTNADGSVDTGFVGEGETLGIFIEITAPSSIGIGVGIDLSLTVTSFLDPSISQDVTCQVAIPARFAQVFRDDADGAMSLLFSQPNQVQTLRVTDQAWWGYNPVVAETFGGNFIALWQRWLTYNNYQSYISVLEFTIFDKNGNTVVPVKEMISQNNNDVDTLDEEPVVAVASDGTIGVAWRRRVVSDSVGGTQENWNIYFLLLNEDGETLEGPINITENEDWYQSTSLNYDVPRFWDPQIKASEKGHFALSWHQEMTITPSENCSDNCKLDDIYYTIFDTMGNLVKPVTKLTADTASSAEAYANPTLSPLTEDRWIVVYSHTQGGMAYSVLDHDGNIVQNNAFIGGTRTGWSPVVLQSRGNDHIIIAFTAWTINNPEINVLVLDGKTFQVVSGPTIFANPAATTGGDFVSLAQDSQGNIIMTWMDFSSSNRHHLYYALLDHAGNILTPAMIFKSAQDPIDANPRIETGLTGYSNSANRQFQDVRLTYWAVNWIERLSDSGITTGCQVDPPLFCPAETTTRAQMAVFLGRAIYGSDYEPAPVEDRIFVDVPAYYWASSWIHQLYADGITRGCSSDPLRYCPEQNISRAEMAVFLVRILYGQDYEAPAATGIFTDVLPTHWAAAEIEQLYRDGITTGCGSTPLRFCPDGSTTRAEIAAFLVRTFNLP